MATPATAVAERIGALRDALNLLGPRQRAVIVLRILARYVRGRDRAGASNCSVGTVKSQTLQGAGYLAQAR